MLVSPPPEVDLPRMITSFPWTKLVPHGFIFFWCPTESSLARTVRAIRKVVCRLVPQAVPPPVAIAPWGRVRQAYSGIDQQLYRRLPGCGFCTVHHGLHMETRQVEFSVQCPKCNYTSMRTPALPYQVHHAALHLHDM